MATTIATWNVNSLRVRLPQVLNWLETAQPDILALQETKVTDELFPREALEAQGYKVAFAGQKTYNGVAILSKKAFTEIHHDIGLPTLSEGERRVLGVSVGELRIWNLYVPNGESTESPKYAYKLAWLAHLRQFFESELQAHPNLVILGDFNIAPDARDVYDPAGWEGKILFSAAEHAALAAVTQLGFQDCFRLHQQEAKHYTWWDYRLNAFKRQLGLRIDLILASEALAKHCKACVIDKTPRGWERPSDHTPVMATFDL